MSKRTIWILIGVVAITMACLLAAAAAGLVFWLSSSGGTCCGPLGRGPAWLQGPGLRRGTYSSNGERIYRTGFNDQGERIPFEGGPMWLSMRGGSCSSCHGLDGQGGAPVMMGTEIPPDIRYEHLLEEEHEEGEEHPPFTDETIKRAITQGVDPAGESLDPTMPRFQMSEEDLDDLLEHLKELD